jgi:hypothetical protein
VGRDEISHDGQNLERDHFDRELDAVLARYAAAEPRAGLEEGVLANLRAQPMQGPNRAWWQWSLAALTAVAIVALALTWKTLPAQREAGSHAPTTKEAPKTPAIQVASASSRISARTNHASLPSARPHHSLPAAAAALPKLDQFPSPEPLTEQEKMLAGYIYQYPKDAALIAEARMESLRLDEEELREASLDTNKNLQ